MSGVIELAQSTAPQKTHNQHLDTEAPKVQGALGPPLKYLLEYCRETEPGVHFGSAKKVRTKIVA
jgi:hypothetical protein